MTPSPYGALSDELEGRDTAPPHLTPRDNRWGRSIEWFDFDARKVHGWLTPVPKVGDVFDTEMESGNIARFKFVEVLPTYNPPDMFFGTVDLVTIFRPEVASLRSLQTGDAK